MDARVLTATPDERLRDETLRCACTVILSGFFETFLKECAAAFIAEISLRNVPFSDLPPYTQLRHFEGGGELLGLKARNHSRASWVSGDHFDLVQRLSSPALRSSNYTLVWEAFATTQGNPGPDVVEEILKSLGVDNRNPRLNTALGGTYSGLRFALGAFILVRNECAHTGTAVNVPTTGAVRSYCTTIEAISHAVVCVLEGRLTEIPFGINLNTATIADLSRIRGLGTRRASALVAYRSAHGLFTDVADVKKVPGFGAKVFSILKLHARI